MLIFHFFIRLLTENQKLVFFFSEGSHLLSSFCLLILYSMPLYKLQLCQAHRYWSPVSHSLSITFSRMASMTPNLCLYTLIAYYVWRFLICITLNYAVAIFHIIFKIFEVMDYFFFPISSSRSSSKLRIW